MGGGGRRAAMILAQGRPPKGIKKAREVTRATCKEELTALMVNSKSLHRPTFTGHP